VEQDIATLLETLRRGYEVGTHPADYLPLFINTLHRFSNTLKERDARLRQTYDMADLLARALQNLYLQHD